MSSILCVVCGDDRDVKNHYGVATCLGCKAFFRRTIHERKAYKCNKFGNCIIDKTSRNKCRACRFKKCVRLGMKEDNLRDTTRTNSVERGEKSFVGKYEENELELPTSSTTPPREIAFDERIQRSKNLIDFLFSLNNVNNDNYDPRYAHVTEEDIIEMDKNYGRDVPLEEGIQHPEKVAPRTRMRYTFERDARREDMAFNWYRLFVMIADYANLIPQFRQLTIEDQCQLFRHNFAVMSWVVYYGDVLDIDISRGLPIGNGSYATWESMEAEYSQLIQKTMIEPFKELEVDAKEICLLKAFLLFQFEENLSEYGTKVCKDIQARLIHAIWDYQNIRYPNITFDEQILRHSKILMIIPKLYQAWHMESDIHLLLTTFRIINLDGIPRELLFYNKTFEKMK